MALLSNRSSVARTQPDPGLHEGAYVTDGRRLFRVVQPINPPRAVASAVLEDCMTLDAQAFTPRQLAEMGLRTVVRTAETAPSDGAEVS